MGRGVSRSLAAIASAPDPDDGVDGTMVEIGLNSWGIEESYLTRTTVVVEQTSAAATTVHPLKYTLSKLNPHPQSHKRCRTPLNKW